MTMKILMKKIVCSGCQATFNGHSNSTRMVMMRMMARVMRVMMMTTMTMMTTMMMMMMTTTVTMMMMVMIMMKKIALYAVVARQHLMGPPLPQEKK